MFDTQKHSVIVALAKNPQHKILVKCNQPAYAADEAAAEAFEFLRIRPFLPQDILQGSNPLTESAFTLCFLPAGEDWNWSLIRILPVVPAAGNRKVSAISNKAPFQTKLTAAGIPSQRNKGSTRTLASGYFTIGSLHLSQVSAKLGGGACICHRSRLI